MKGAWKTATLDDACDFYNGLWKGEKPPFVMAGVIRNTNFASDGTLDDTDIAYLEVEERKLEKRRLQWGDIILEKSGGGPKQPVGRVALFDKTDGVYSFSNFTSALRVRDPNQLDFRFLHRFLYWTYISGKTAAIQSHSTGIRNLDSDAYKAITIGIPPLPEQRRMVAILDQAFEAAAVATANAERCALLSEDILASYRDALFEEYAAKSVPIELGDIIETTLIGLDKGIRFQSVDHECPYIKMNNITRDNRLDMSKLTAVRATKEEREKFAVRSGDLLFNTRNSYELVGKACVYEPVDSRTAIFNNNIMRIRLKEGVVPAFVLASLSSTRVARELNALKSGTTNVWAIYFKGLRTLRIPMVPIDQQRDLLTRLSALTTGSQDLIRVFRRKIGEIGALKKSLLDFAFNGSL